MRHLYVDLIIRLKRYYFYTMYYTFLIGATCAGACRPNCCVKITFPNAAPAVNCPYMVYYCVIRWLQNNVKKISI